jgi:hypothetical protein
LDAHQPGKAIKIGVKPVRAHQKKRTPAFAGVRLGGFANKGGLFKNRLTAP